MSEHQIDPRYGVPILGTAKASTGPNAPGLTAACEVYDSEINEIHKILDLMNTKAQSRVEYDAFDREMRERFQDIGFIIAINWWETNVEGVLMPEITIRDRTERGHTFDHDKQVHEVTNDLLDLGEGGVIKSGPIIGGHEGHGH